MEILKALILIAIFFLLGNAYVTSKYARKQRGLTERIKALEDFKQDMIEVVDYFPKELHGISIPVKEDKTKENEDTKTGELEIVKQGNPNDA